MKNKILIGVFTALYMSGANVVFATSISDTVSMAIKYHPSINSAKARLGEKEFEVKEAKSEMFPTMGFNGGFGGERVNNDTTRGNLGRQVKTYTGDARFYINQPLFDGLKVYKKLDAAKLRKKSAEFDLKENVEKLGLKAVDIHLLIIKSRSILSMIDKSIISAQAKKDKIQELFNDGVVDLAEVMQAEESILSLESTKLEYEKDLFHAETEYFEITGTKPKGNLKVSEQDRLSDNLPKNANGAINNALANNARLSSLDELIKAYELDTKALRAEISPKINAELSHTESDQQDNAGGESRSSKAMVQASWEFGLGGGYTARIKKSMKLREEAKASYNAERYSLEKDIKKNYINLDNFAKQYKNNLSREDKNQNILDNVNDKYEGGSISLLQIINAENKLLQSSIARVNSYHGIQKSKYAVLAAMGDLSSNLNVK